MLNPIHRCGVLRHLAILYSTRDFLLRPINAISLECKLCPACRDFALNLCPGPPVPPRQFGYQLSLYDLSTYFSLPLRDSVLITDQVLGALTRQACELSYSLAEPVECNYILGAVDEM